MEQKSSITGCAMNAALETTLAVELFLNENYCFRRNVLNGKVEFFDKLSCQTDELEDAAEPYPALLSFGRHQSQQQGSCGTSNDHPWL